MKFFFLLVTVAVTACNSTPKAVETATLVKPDSAYVARPELPVVNPVAATPVTTVEQKKVITKNSTASNSATTNSSSTSQNSTTAPAKKKGWSKTAKGAVIGGVVGAGTGAIVNKRNRGAGAVIGGVLGA